LPPRKLPSNNPEVPEKLYPRKRKLAEIEKSEFIESPKKRLRANPKKVE
jgi:hypothetical protein